MAQDLLRLLSNRFVSLSASLTLSPRAGNLNRKAKLRDGGAIKTHERKIWTGCCGMPMGDRSSHHQRRDGEKFYGHILFRCNFETKSLFIVDFRGNHDEDEMNSRNVGTKRARLRRNYQSPKLVGKRMCSDRDLIGGTSGIEERENEKRASAEISSHRYVIIASCLFRRGHWLDWKENLE